MRVPQTGSPALNQFLFKERGFHGSRAEYYARSNSYLNEVIDDREGLPLTLSVLYLELAQRLDLPMAGVGLPGILSCVFEPPAGPKQLIDVFEGPGSSRKRTRPKRWRTSRASRRRRLHLLRLEKSDCLGGFCTTCSARPARKGSRGMLRYLDGIVTVDADAHAERWVRAVLRFQTGQRDGARSDCDYLLEREPPRSTSIASANCCTGCSKLAAALSFPRSAWECTSGRSAARPDGTPERPGRAFHAERGTRFPRSPNCPTLIFVGLPAGFDRCAGFGATCASVARTGAPFCTGTAVPVETDETRPSFLVRRAPGRRRPERTPEDVMMTRAGAGRACFSVVRDGSQRDDWSGGRASKLRQMRSASLGSVGLAPTPAVGDVTAPADPAPLRGACPGARPADCPPPPPFRERPCRSAVRIQGQRLITPGR